MRSQRISLWVHRNLGDALRGLCDFSRTSTAFSREDRMTPLRPNEKVQPTTKWG